jgi:hypothetical protein
MEERERERERERVCENYEGWSGNKNTKLQIYILTRDRLWDYGIINTFAEEDLYLRTLCHLAWPSY